MHAIRLGGQETPIGFQFELSGGAVPLDLANTLDERPRGGLERLTGFHQLVRWSEQSGLLTPQGADTLIAAARQAPHMATQVLGDAMALRELIFATVKATVGASVLTDHHVQCWNEWLRRVRSVRSLAAGPEGLEWRTVLMVERLDGIVLEVAERAVEMFLDPAIRPRLRVCAADNCDWVFLDRSRRQNRVWCDMMVCGNRAKATRHYRRKIAP